MPRLALSILLVTCLVSSFTISISASLASSHGANALGVNGTLARTSDERPSLARATLKEAVPLEAPINTATNGSLILMAPSLEIVRAGSSLTFPVNASAPSNSTISCSLAASGLPSGASFPPSIGNPAIQNFAWLTTSTQAYGNYTVVFFATDGSKPPARASLTTIIQVTNAILPPVLTVPGHQAAEASTILALAVVASDPNIPPMPIIISASGLPAGSNFNPQSGVFTWTPTDAQAPGIYVIIFTASNSIGGFTSKSVTITISGSTLRAASLSTIEGPMTAWLLPISIGLVFGMVPWVGYEIKRRGERKRMTGNGLDSPKGGPQPPVRANNTGSEEHDTLT